MAKRPPGNQDNHISFTTATFPLTAAVLTLQRQPHLLCRGNPITLLCDDITEIPSYLVTVATTITVWWELLMKQYIFITKKYCSFVILQSVFKLNNVKHNAIKYKIFINKVH